MPDVPPLVVVVAFHAAVDVAAAVRAAQPHDVLVVDNSSSSAVHTAAREAGAQYCDSGANLGFARAVNLGIDRAGGRDVVLVNPDARVGPDVLEALVARLHRPGRRVAAASPRLYEDGGVPQRARWPFPTPGGAWLVALGLGRWQRDEGGFLVGAVLALNGAAVAELGVFDPSFFLYAEETDWQRRARDAGWELVLADDLTATHVGGGSSTDESRREVHFHAGTERYVRKWFGPWGWTRYGAGVVAGSAVRGVVLPRERGAVARRRARLYLRGPLRCEAELP